MFQLANQMHACLAYIDDKAPLSVIEGQPDMNQLLNFPRVQPDGIAPSQGRLNETQQNMDGSVITGIVPQQQQLQYTQAQAQAQAQVADADGTKSPPYMPDPPDIFEDALHELADDLVKKERQIELLIDSLPGRGFSQMEQEKRMKELEVQLKAVEEEHKESIREKEALLQRLDAVIAKVRRY